MKILLSCLLFLLITAIYSYSALQQSNAKAKDSMTLKEPINLKQKPNNEKPQKTENVVIKKDKKRQTTPTPTVNTPQSSVANANVSTSDQKAVGGSATSAETPSISSQPTQSADYNIPPSSPAQQNVVPQVPPQPPVPPQTSELDRAVAAQTAKDAWATQSNQTSNTPTNDNIVVNSSSNTVNPANGTYSTNQVITSPGNSATLNTAGEVKIITGTSN